MVMKGYSILLRVQEVEPYYQVLVSIISRILLFDESFTIAMDTIRVFEAPTIGC